MNTKTSAIRRSQHALVGRHRCQFLRDNGKLCGKLAGKHKVRVFLDSSCTHGHGWCAVWACKDHEFGKYQSPNSGSTDK